MGGLHSKGMSVLVQNLSIAVVEYSCDVGAFGRAMVVNQCVG